MNCNTTHYRANSSSVPGDPTLLLDDRLGERFPFATFFFAVLFTAWYGGLGPGLVALVLGALATDYYFLEPRHSFMIQPVEQQVAMALFLLLGFTSTLLTESLRRAQRRAEESLRKLAHKQQLLEDEGDVRRRSEQVIQGQREEFRVALASIGDAVIVTDNTGQITFLNPVAETLTDWRYEEARGLPLEDIFQTVDEPTRKPAENPVTRVMREGTIVGLGNRSLLLDRDGGERPIDESAAPIRDARGQIRGVILVFRDVTVRRREEKERLALLQSEQAARAQAEAAQGRAAFLAEASTVLTSSLDYETTLGVVARLAVPLVADWCSVQVLEENETLRNVAVAHVDPAKAEWARELGRRYPPDPRAGHGVYRVLQTGQAEIYPEIPETWLQESARDAGHLAILRQLGMKSVMIVPLVARERTLGVLSFVAAESGQRYGAEDLELAEDLARRAALAVDNARLYREAYEAVRVREEALQEREQALELHRSVEEQLRLLAEASGTLTSSLELPDVLAAILRLSQRLIAADAYAVWRSHPSSGWEIVSSAGLSPVYLQTASRITDSFRAMPEQPLLAENVLEAPMLEDRRDAYRREGIRSLLVVPLRTQGQVSGTLSFYYRTPRQFREGEVRVATALVNLAGSAIETAELYQEESRARARAEAVQQRLALLADASNVLGSSLDYRTTLDQVARLAVPRFADYCIVYMVEDDQCVRSLAVAHQELARSLWLRDLLDRYPLNPAFEHGYVKAVSTGEPDLIPQFNDSLLGAASQDAEHLTLLRQLDPRSSISVPLAVRGRVLGAISFLTAESARCYDSDDLALAEELARRAATAIDNSCLYHALQQADRRKDEFLALLGHELRNPLAPIRSALEVLQRRGSDDPVARQMRSMMVRQTEHLTRLVDDLLDVSRISRNKIELRREPLDVATIIPPTVESVRPALDERGHTLEVSLAPEPLRVDADPTRLEQILANLLNNASKYTEPGGKIWLQASLEAEDGAAHENGGRDQVVIRVKDTGIGIRPEKLAHIFELFTQADRIPGQVQEGLGIGLTLVRNLVELHGGTVEARSPGPGQGSEFIVRLPALPESLLLPVHPAPEAARPSGNAHHVLVVDDNVDAATSLALVLELDGHEVRLAHDGPAALEVARVYRPDVVLLDIGLPQGMSGYDVARQLREETGLERTLLVALTGFGQDEDRRRSREAGFDFHLTKPVDPSELQQLLVEPRRNGG